MEVKKYIQLLKDKFNQAFINSRNEKVREEMLKDHNKQIQDKFVDDTGRNKNQTQ